MKDAIRLRAFAKINLGLSILGRRADGYHNLRTVYQTIALHDRLEISLRARGIEVAVEGEESQVPSGKRNLVYRACVLWCSARRYRGGVHVRLLKRIPSGSGLGGASSDAASAVLGLERLTGNRLERATRLKLAARLGMDVPLFFLGGRVLGSGRGERVTPLGDLPARECLVVFPRFSASTAEMYAKLRLTKKRRASSIKTLGAWPRVSLRVWGPAENDFEQVVFARWPELADLKAQLIRAGAEIASLTGSGSALYAFFASVRQLARASERVPSGYRKYRTRTLPRDEYWKRLIVAG